jgi:hypothetical protein
MVFDLMKLLEVFWPKEAMDAIPPLPRIYTSLLSNWPWGSIAFGSPFRLTLSDPVDGAFS